MKDFCCVLKLPNMSLDAAVEKLNALEPKPETISASKRPPLLRAALAAYWIVAEHARSEDTIPLDLSPFLLTYGDTPPGKGYDTTFNYIRDQALQVARSYFGPQTSLEDVTRLFSEMDRILQRSGPTWPIAAEEVVSVPTVGELEKLDDPNARQLAQEARAAGYSHVVLIPKELSEEADFEDLVVTLFAQESVMTQAMAVLTPEEELTLRAYPHYVPPKPGRVAEFLRKHITEEIQTPVVALDAAFEGVVGQILPANHPLTFLLDAGEHHLMPYRKAIATLFTNPPKEGLRNLILKLSRGSVRSVTIGGRDYTAIFA